MPKIVIPQKASTDYINQVFDFTSYLASGVTVSSASCACTVYSGIDPSPSALISGSASASGTKVTQLVIGGVSGVIYSLSCAATCSDSSVITLTGYLAILP